MHLRVVGILAAPEPQPQVPKMESMFGAPSSGTWRTFCNPGAQTWVQQLFNFDGNFVDRPQSRQIRALSAECHLEQTRDVAGTAPGTLRPGSEVIKIQSPSRISEENARRCRSGLDFMWSLLVRSRSCESQEYPEDRG